MSRLVGLLPAAGRGSRLGTTPCSKEIMPLGFSSYFPHGEDIKDGKQAWRPVTTIEVHLQAFRMAGVKRTAIIIGNSKFDIMRYLGDGHRYNVPITYFYQEKLQGMPFALDIPHPWIQNDTILFSMPDTLITPVNTMTLLIENHYQNQADVTLGLFPTKTPEKFGMVDLQDKQIVGFVDKPRQTNLRYMWGIAAWSPTFTDFMHSYLSGIVTSEKECVLSDIFEAALREGLTIQPMFYEDGRYHDIGTPSSFQAAVYELALQQITENSKQK